MDIIEIKKEEIIEQNHIKIIRSNYTLKSTTGRIYLGCKSEPTAHTLEDVVRAFGVKIKRHTAIPPGIYRWSVTHSNRFKRKMISIWNVKDKNWILVAGGIQFNGARIHGGNTHENTEGCPLVAYNKINDDTIQGTAEKEITAWAIDVGGEGTIEIINNPQSA
jgi:hypothetical protein